MKTVEIKVGDLVEFVAKEHIDTYFRKSGALPTSSCDHSGKPNGTFLLQPGDLCVVVGEMKQSDEYWILYSQKHQKEAKWNKSLLTCDKWFKKVE